MTARKPNETTLTQKARKHSDEALQTLIDVARDKDAPPASRLAAANALLDRAYGKTQNLILEENTLPPRQIRIIAVEKTVPKEQDDEAKTEYVGELDENFDEDGGHENK